MKEKTRTIVMVALPGVQLLDVSGPLDVFAEANAQVGREAYRLLVAATEPGPLRSSSGVRLMADWVIGRDFDDPIDTLLVAGCPNATELPADGVVLDWLRQRAPTVRRYGSVCSGAFFLAAAGLLAGRRVTTHWAVAEALARRFPEVTVEEDLIHVCDGPVRTAAGVTTGLDLALALVEEDLGHEVAKRVASQLVMFFKRPGGQLQFSRKGERHRPAARRSRNFSAGSPSIPHRITALPTSPSGWISARATSPGFSAARSASRRQAGLRRRGFMRPAAFSNGAMRRPSRWRPSAALPMPIRCVAPSPAMSA